jgi:hypothetical protein
MGAAMTDRELMQMALDALEKHVLEYETAEALRARLAQPERAWQGLTNDEVNNFAAGCHLGKSVQGAIYEAAAKLKEKNT